MMLIVILMSTISAIALTEIREPLNEYSARLDPWFNRISWDQFKLTLELEGIYYDDAEMLFYTVSHDGARIVGNNLLVGKAMYYGYGGNLSEHVDIDRSREENGRTIANWGGMSNITWEDFVVKLEVLGWQYDPTSKIFTREPGSYESHPGFINYPTLKILADDLGYAGNISEHFSNESLNIFFDTWSIDKQELNTIMDLSLDQATGEVTSNTIYP